jgi:ribonuclease Z
LKVFRVTLLGTGKPLPQIDRFGPSLLVEAGREKLLFDCGRGALQRIFQVNIPLGDVNTLFLTHLHSDHVVGIPDLWLTGWLHGRWEAPLSVYGPVGTQNMMSKLEEAFEYDVYIRRDVDEKVPGEGAKIVTREIEEGVIYEKDGLKVTAFEVDHWPIEPSFGYRVDFEGKSVVFSGDTRFCENLIEFSKNVDLLVSEVGAGPLDKDLPEVRQKVLAHHLSPKEAGEVFSRSRPKLAVLTHIVAYEVDFEEIIKRTSEVYDGHVQIGEDLMAFEIGETVEILHAIV